MSPAEELRTAAKLMRERANVAALAPWSATYVPRDQKPSLHPLPSAYLVVNAVGANLAGTGDGESGRVNAEYIASWHPGVALAVADWLDAAEQQAAYYEMGGAQIAPESYALKVARAYLAAVTS